MQLADTKVADMLLEGAHTNRQRVVSYRRDGAFKES